MKSVRGSVLLTVLGVLLLLSILLTSLIRLPGALRRTIARVVDETQQMYMAESAVIAKLNGFPEGYFADLPSMETHLIGPWILWRTEKFQFLLGNAYAHFRTSEWMHCEVQWERFLRERIMQTDGLKNLTGNRRIFELDSSWVKTRYSPVALKINSGDLTLDLGSSGSFDKSNHVHTVVHSFMANVDGNVNIRGNVHFDTLRIYATGSVMLHGNVSVGFAEIFGHSNVSITNKVALSGMLLSKQEIEISGYAKLRFPSVALALGYHGNRLSLKGKSVLEGLALAPSGVVDLDSSATLLDSSKALLPFCMDSQKVVFERRRL